MINQIYNHMEGFCYASKSFSQLAFCSSFRYVYSLPRDNMLSRMQAGRIVSIC